MSGGIEDIHKEQREEQNFNDYYKTILNYLKTPCDSNNKKVKKAANACNTYSGYPRDTDIDKMVENLLWNLIQKNKKIWIDLLIKVNRFVFDEFFKLSPFDKNDGFVKTTRIKLKNEILGSNNLSNIIISNISDSEIQDECYILFKNIDIEVIK